MTEKLSWHKLITVLLLIVGGMLSMMSFLSLDIKDRILPVLLICAASAACALLSRVGFFTQRYDYIPVGLAILIFIAAPTGILRGSTEYVNLLLQRWNDIYHSTFVPNTQTASVLELQLFLMVIGCLGAFLMLYMMKRNKYTAAFLTVIASLLIQMLLYESSAVSICFILIGILSLSVESMHIKLRTMHKVWLGGAFLLIIISAALFSSRTTQFTQTLRQELYEKQHTICYGDDLLPKGDLYEANQMMSGSEDTLVINTEARQKLYLRGFVGSQYEQGKWSELSPNSYGGKYKGIFNWLSKQNFSPLNQYDEYQNAGKSDENAVSVSVKNIGADREYLYAPYSVQNISDGVARFDQQFRSHHFFGAKQYSYQCLTDGLPTELISADKWIESPETDKQQIYVSAEAVYRDFVYENYLDIDKNTKQSINAYFCSDTSEENTGVYYATQQIRKILRENVSYAKEFDEIPQGNDPIKYFLSVSHKGNSALFASAAVQAYRAYGIPARYVEGYLADMENASSDEVTLTEQDSHAWVEIYMDGVGWMPIDVTPGFYYETELLQQMISQPDKIKETAAPKNNTEHNADDTVMNTQGQDSASDKDKDYLRKILHFILLGVDIIGSVCLILLIVLELRHLWRKYHIYVLLTQSQNTLCTEQLWSEIVHILKQLGIQYSLGFDTKDTEQNIIDRGLDIRAGEYQRVSQLMEKRLYGEQQLTLWEQRVISGFLTKCWRNRGKLTFKDRLKLRYL